MRTVLKKIITKVKSKKSFKSYFLYALGEIVLIVLSLLLALQLNELNKQRQNNNLRSSFYKLLIADYKTDIEQIQIAEKSFQKELDNIDGLGQRLNSSLATTDTLIKIARNEFNPNIPPFVSYKTTTLETLKEAGYLELIDDEILREIYALQILQDEQNFYQTLTLESHARLLEKYINNYPLKNGVVNKGILYEELWSEIEPKNLLLEFNGLLTITRSTLINGSFYYKKISKETEKLIEFIESKQTK